MIIITRFIYNICSEADERSEDSFFTRDAWDHSLGAADEFKDFDRIIVVPSLSPSSPSLPSPSLPSPS
jgi:hypothetical protein